MLLTLAVLVGLSGGDLQRANLTVAQGYVESGMNAKAKGKCGERGAWQVIPKEHGKVPKDLHGQAKQAERILDELLAENDNDPFEALVKYNSFKNRKAGVAYAKKVRKKAFEVSLLDLTYIDVAHRNVKN